LRLLPTTEVQRQNFSGCIVDCGLQIVQKPEQGAIATDQEIPRQNRRIFRGTPGQNFQDEQAKPAITRRHWP
jgi:hypothetical protein